MLSTANDWQAESDAHTLIDAEVIKADSERLNKAITAAGKILNEIEEKQKITEKIAKAKILYPSMEKKDNGK